MYPNIDRNIIHNGQKVEKLQLSISQWKDKYNMVYSYNKILFSNKKEWTIHTCHNMDRIKKILGMVKNTVTKEHVSLFPMSRISKSVDKEDRLVVIQGFRVWGK